MSIKTAIFASGSGSNAENIIRFFSKKEHFEFPVIISNKAEAYIHERAKKMGIPSFTFSREEFADGKEIISLLDKYEVSHIILAGFLLKVSQAFLDNYPDRIVNIHPALLPKFGGRGMYGHHVHEAVVEAGEAQSGITIHYVNANYDEGSIIFQATCPVLPNDTPEQVAEKVHALEYEYFPKIIAEIWG